MIDNLSILLSHGLLLFMLWRLLPRDDLDREPDPQTERERGAEEQGAQSAPPGGWLGERAPAAQLSEVRGARPAGPETNGRTGAKRRKLQRLARRRKARRDA